MKAKELILSVEELDHALYFLFTYRDKKIYFNQIGSYWFDALGAKSSIKVAVWRRGEKIDEGYIQHRGTHGSSEFFVGLEKVVPKIKQFTTGVTSDNIQSSYFFDKDIVHIEVAKTKTQFFNDLIRSVSLPGDKERAREHSQLYLKQCREIAERHNGKEKVIKMLRTKLSHLDEQRQLKNIEDRKKMKIIIGTAI